MKRSRYQTVNRGRSNRPAWYCHDELTGRNTFISSSRSIADGYVRGVRKLEREGVKTGRAHITLDGSPLCERALPAYRERFERAGFPLGMPICEGTRAECAERFRALSRVIAADRLCLVDGPCPAMAAAEDAGR